MHRLKFIVLAIVAALAIIVVAAASASAALPEWRTGGGKPLTVPIAFEASSPEGTLETDNGNKVTCKSDTAAGKAEGEKTASHVTVKFAGCKGPFGEACGVKGEIPSALLSGELVYLNAAQTKVGLELNQNAITKEFANFDCGFSGKVKVTGNVIGEVTPPGTEVEKGKLIYQQTAGEQKWHTIEEKAEPPDITSYTEIFGVTSESALASEDTVTWLPAGTKVGVV